MRTFGYPPQVITGELKSKIDRIWDAFWSGGISNPIEVIEQITYLLFLRRLDDLHTLEENKANRLKRPIQHPIFPVGQDDLRWSTFKNLEPAVMFKIVDERMFPFLRQLGGDGSTYSHHMKDARFTIPTPALLSRVVDMLDDVPMQDRDTNGDLYEYLLISIVVAISVDTFRIEARRRRISCSSDHQPGLNKVEWGCSSCRTCLASRRRRCATAMTTKAKPSADRATILAVPMRRQPPLTGRSPPP